jgi:hypothetical protein
MALEAGLFEPFPSSQIIAANNGRDSMSAFYFLIHDSDGDFVNDEPYQYPDLLTALEAAKFALTEMAADGIPLENGGSVAIDVQNEDHASVATLELRFSLQFTQPAET